MSLIIQLRIVNYAIIVLCSNHAKIKHQISLGFANYCRLDHQKIILISCNAEVLISVPRLH